jgi:hypothetical protein
MYRGREKALGFTPVAPWILARQDRRSTHFEKGQKAMHMYLLTDDFGNVVDVFGSMALWRRLAFLVSDRALSI